MADTVRAIDTGTLLRETGRIASLVSFPVLATLSVCVGLGVAIDTLITDSELVSLLTIVASFVQIALQLWVVVAALRRVDIATDSGARLIGLFILSIPLTIGIGVGLLLLIVPGVFLAARWRIAVPLLVSSRLGIGEALRSSWTQTTPHTVPLMLTTVIVGLPVVASFAAYWFVDESSGQAAVIWAIAANMLLYAGSIAVWLLDVAAFRLIANPRDALAETFA